MSLMSIPGVPAGPDLDLDKVQPGDYELIVHSWDEITSKPGQPFDYVTHRKGDVVTLDIEQARRLIAGGAVKALEFGEPTGDGDAEPAPATVEAIVAVAAEDPAAAKKYLDEELAKGERARKTLVEKLSAIVSGT